MKSLSNPKSISPHPENNDNTLSAQFVSRSQQNKIGICGSAAYIFEHIVWLGYSFCFAILFMNQVRYLGTSIPNLLQR